MVYIMSKRPFVSKRLDTIDAHRFLKDELNRDSIYSKYYTGLIEHALLLGSRGCGDLVTLSQSQISFEYPALRYGPKMKIQRDRHHQCMLLSLFHLSGFSAFW